MLKRNNEKHAEEYYNEAFRNNGEQRVKEKIEEAKKLIEEFPDDKKSKIFKFLDNNDQLEEVKDNLQNWDKTKELLQQGNPFHSWFCELMNCLKKLEGEIIESK